MGFLFGIARLKVKKNKIKNTELKKNEQITKQKISLFTINIIIYKSAK